MTKMLSLLRNTLLVLTAALALSSTSVLADAALEPLFKATPPPAGVVFEIVTGSAESLDWALPQVKSYITEIRKRYPDMPVAIVTHGREMFSLQKGSKTKSAGKVRKISQQLVKDGATLHVCGTYAGYRGLSEEDFPEFVNVAAEGPAQINDYVAVGYLRIVVERPLTSR